MCHRPTYTQDSGRLAVPLPELWLWIDEEVAEQVKAQNVFTAYSITKLLRVQHPEHEIVHYDVNMRVHAIMEIVHHYAMNWQSWNGYPARTYSPQAVELQPARPFELAVLSGLAEAGWEAKDD